MNTPKAKASKYGAGPWADEPDSLTWDDEKTGYRCHIWRNRMGALCGYVRVPESHPLHGVEYSADIPEAMKPLLDVVMDGPVGKRGAIQVFCAAGGVTRVDILFDVHGGITFSGEPAGADGGHWFGFDCGHAGDLSPGLPFRSAFDDAGDEYRDIEYVKAECASLARQLRQVAG